MLLLCVVLCCISICECKSVASEIVGEELLVGRALGNIRDTLQEGFDMIDTRMNKMEEQMMETEDQQQQSMDKLESIIMENMQKVIN